MIEAAKDAQHDQDCSAMNPDPNSYWMKKFLNLIKDKLPQQAVEWEDLLPNLQRLVEYDEKGYLRAIAKGEINKDSLVFPDEHLRPYIITAYMPCKYPPERLPTIVLEQIFNGDSMYKEIVGGGDDSRKKRSVGDEDTEGLRKSQPQAFYHDRQHYSDNIPAIDGHFLDHEVDEAEMGDDGEIRSRKRRSLPEGMAIFPPKHTLFTVETICVKATESGEIILPTV